MESFVIEYWRLTIDDWRFFPRSPREICKTVISQGKSAKKEAKIELKMQKKANFVQVFGVFSWLIWKNKANLRMGKMSLSIYKKGYYEEFHALGRRENKANSKPNKPNHI